MLTCRSLLCQSAFGYLVMPLCCSLILYQNYFFMRQRIRTTYLFVCKDFGFPTVACMTSDLLSLGLATAEERQQQYSNPLRLRQLFHFIPRERILHDGKEEFLLQEKRAKQGRDAVAAHGASALACSDGARSTGNITWLKLEQLKNAEDKVAKADDRSEGRSRSFTNHRRSAFDNALLIKETNPRHGHEQPGCMRSLDSLPLPL